MLKFALALAKAMPGCSTVGSAPRSGRGGRKFESSHPDCNKKTTFKILTMMKVVFVIMDRIIGMLAISLCKHPYYVPH